MWFLPLDNLNRLSHWQTRCAWPARDPSFYLQITTCTVAKMKESSCKWAKRLRLMQKLNQLIPQWRGPSFPATPPGSRLLAPTSSSGLSTLSRPIVLDFICIKVSIWFENSHLITVLLGQTLKHMDFLSKQMALRQARSRSKEKRVRVLALNPENRVLGSAGKVYPIVS